MRLGIDLGTTRTVVAAVDRGNYPVAGFTSEDGELQEWLPSRQDGVSSFKRQLARARIGEPAFAITVAFLQRLEHALRHRSNLSIPEGEELEAVVGIPANASSTQRFLTVEAFRAAGFQVLAVVNEPSAAGLEFAHRHRKAITSFREHVLVYDLGGGTFDASLIDMGDRDHRVLSSSGVGELGGDDFDRVLLELAIEKGKLGALSPAVEKAILDECCQKKESLQPQTKKIVLDLSAIAPGRELVLSVADVFERCTPLVERTVEALLSALKTPTRTVAAEDVAGVYVVGGASALPVVGRILRERFGRRVFRSPYSFAATAIGLAIAADEAAGVALSDCFTRHFGVWREEAGGEHASFDTIFAKDTPLPASGGGPLASVRRYQASHNIGHFRFLECSHLGDAGIPSGDLMLRREVRFPFDAGLRNAPSLDQLPVTRKDGGPMIEERYECTTDGIVHLTVTSLADGFSRKFPLV